MLRQAKEAGTAEALRVYGIKLAAVPAKPGALGAVASSLGHMFLGNPQELQKGLNLFKPGEMLHWRNLFWPVKSPAPGASFWGKARTHAGNVFNVGMSTALPAYALYQGLSNPDPSKGKLTNALGTIGEAAGATLGYPVGGMLGGAAISRLGRSLGEGAGNLLGSKPEYHDMYPGQLS